MHGYEPDMVVPTTELVLSHKHPEDSAAVSALLNRARHAAEPFSSRYRIITTHGETRWVVVAADRMYDRDGQVVGISGFYIDVTEAETAEVQSAVNEAIADIVDSRAAIEQAKGVLMLAYGISAERAFDVLVWRSQETNVKVRELARRLLAGLTAVDIPRPARERIDYLLLALDERAS